MKKILFLQNKGKSYGGVWQVNKLVGEALIENGYEISIVSIRNNQNNKEPEHNPKLKIFTINEKDIWGTYSGSEIFSELKKLNFKKALSEIISRIKYTIRIKKDIKTLHQYIYKENPDYIVTSHYELLNMIPKEYLNKTFHEQHSSWMDVINHKATKKVLEKYKNKIKFIWLTKQTYLKAMQYGFTNSVYIYNAVRFKSNKIADVCNNKKLITIARLDTEKRISLMINIVDEIFKDEEFKDWTLEIFGTGEEEEKLKRMNKNKRIKFMGKTDNPQKELLSSSINLNTSIHEGFCLSILEANECGVPTITFDFGESVSEEIINGKTGIIAASQEEYISELKDLMKNNTKLEKMSKNSKEFMQEFQIEKIVKDWIKLFK